MNAEMLFLDNISKLKKHILIKILNQIILITLLIFLGIYTLAVGIEKIGVAQVLGEVLFYVIAFGIALVCSVIYAYIKRKRFIQVLIDIDRRLNLQDRISTAYEYHTLRKKSEFGELLIKDAGHKLSLLSNKQLFPVKFSIVYLLLGGLIVANLALFFVDYFSHAPEQAQFDQTKSEELRKLLREFTAKKPESETKAKQEVKKKTYKKLEDIAKKLEQRAMTPSELVREMNKMLREVQSDQNQLTEDLNSQLEELDDAEETPVQQLPQLQQQQLSESDMQRLREMLDEMLKNQIPQSIQQDLDSLDENRSLMEFLSQILDDIQSDTTDLDKTAESTSAEGDATGQNENGSNLKQSDSSEPPENELPFKTQQDKKSASQEGEDSSKQADSGEKQGRIKYGGVERDGKDPGETASISAGREKAGDEQGSAHEIETAEGLARQDKGISGKSDYTIHIRSVTNIGKATSPEEDVTRPYQQEIENVLEKEDIPLNYREYIKNYFISIGLRQERQ